jgi:hypothetical protein
LSFNFIYHILASKSGGGSCNKHWYRLKLSFNSSHHILASKKVVEVATSDDIG